ncbi:unnamed protein product [Prunus armeniaca]
MDSAPTALLVRKIIDVLENEAYSIAAVRDEVDEIKQELISMTSFLEDVDGKKTETEAQKAWVTSVRDLTSDVEDIIDEFMYHMYEQQSRGRFARWLHRTIHIPKNLFYRRKIANKLHKITKMIKAIPERNKRYALEGVVGTSWDDISKWVKNQAVSSLFVNEDELVGIDGKKQTLTAWLLNEEQHLTVVSVVGMGGSGKTTLVAKTFTNETVKRHFDSYAWITVSQTYVIEDLFRSLIKELHQTRNEDIPADLLSMGYRDLIQLLLNYLESKRYLVVLDDVWDIKLWREMRISLPDRQLGSRIMLTTQKEDIAFHCFGVESHVHCMQPLEKNYAWELFSRKSFSTFDGKCCPPELEKLAWELMEKCKGLPLAIIALGGLMSSKKSAAEWSKVYNGLNWHLTSHHLLEPVKSILLLSFNDLPYRLKHCFLYCSLFPEDYLIRRKRLIRLWIAEGFVEHARGVTPEQIADSYLMELIFRNMLQVVERNETGRPKSCKMHDLMRELALSTSEKEKFSVVHDGKEVLEDIRARRLSIQTTQGGIESCIGMSRPRSFLVFVTGIFSFSFSKSLPSGFKLSRVIDLEDVQIDKLPHNLVYLFNLRYLSLKGTKIKELPKAIGLLRNLQTLNILNTKIEVLPTGISKLQNLRHIIMLRHSGENMAFRMASGTRVPLNISKLKKLEVLSFVESEGNIIRLIGNMTQLTKIGITNVKERDAMDLCDSIQKLKLLQYLAIGVSGEEEFLDINELSSPPPHLRRLFFASKLQKVPPWFSSLQNLTYLYLHWTRLEEDLLPHIEALPCLGRLVLVNAYVGNELCFNRGFPKLTILELFNFPLLNKITIAKGVMRNLRLLTLGRCMELKALPQGFEYLSKLETLELLSVSMQLIESIQEGGVDHPTVKHITVITNYRLKCLTRAHHSSPTRRI